jgi:large subunit ribosomal protein L29
MKADELREMSDEQLQLTLKEACERLFRLRMQAQTERLDAPSELRHHRRLIARAKTIQREREMRADQAAEDSAVQASGGAGGSVVDNG